MQGTSACFWVMPQWPAAGTPFPPAGAMPANGIAAGADSVASCGRQDRGWTFARRHGCSIVVLEEPRIPLTGLGSRQLIQATVILLATWFLVNSSALDVPAPRSSPSPPAASPPPPATGTLHIPNEVLFGASRLLAFKAGLTDPGNYLSSWRGEDDCCQWTGIECSNRTGHVIKLQIKSNSATDDLNRSGPLGGNISSSLLTLRHMKHLDLSWNNFGGKPIREFIGGLKSLTHLLLSNSHFGGRIPPHLGNLSNLISLDLSTQWESCYSPDLAWVSNLRNLGYLAMNDVDLSAAIDWTHAFWITMYTVQVLDLSENKIVGRLPTFFLFGGMEAAILDISSNELVGPIPTLPNNLYYLDLSRNNLSGVLPSDIGAPALGHLMLFKNSFSGTFPCSLFELEKLEFVDLSENQLNGTLPDCPGAPKTSNITMLNLNTNNLSGEFPSFLQRCKELKFLDLAYNKFSGSIPTWIGSKLPYLVFLRLRSNMSSGGIPIELTRMKGIQCLDIASNNISGNIPLSFGNLIAMAHTPDEQGALFKIVTFGVGGVYKWTNIYTDSLLVVTKGQQLEYIKGLAYMVNIDLSCNRLTGQIPEEIGSLVALKSLNLSWNNFSGIIPQTIGELQAVESFDLSHNELSGEIPTSLADLTSLAHLNLSYNNLTGTIPSGNQLRALDDQATIYIGNPGLCGPPVSRNCSGTKITPQAPEDQHEGMTDALSLYLGITTGFVAGLWIVLCGFLFKWDWRIRCFLLSDSVYDWVYVQVMLSWASLTRKNQ
ncbi:hypothetical protein ACQ4PT_002252 [Festuca glaucescens]